MLHFWLHPSKKKKMGHELFSGHGMAQLVCMYQYSSPLTSTWWLTNMTIGEILGFTNSEHRDKTILVL